MVNSDKDKIKQLLSILIDNAVKYTDKDGTISINTAQDRDAVVISIANDYKNAAHLQAEKLFERFYQASTSHSNKGYGLRLTIAKGVAEDIGATLSVATAPGSVTFALRLK